MGWTGRGTVSIKVSASEQKSVTPRVESQDSEKDLDYRGSLESKASLRIERGSSKRTNKKTKRTRTPKHHSSHDVPQA